MKAIPQDHPNRRELARLEKETAAALEQALAAYERALFSGVTAQNPRQVLYNLESDKARQALQDALVARLQAAALAGAKNGRQAIEKDVYGVT